MEELVASVWNVYSTFSNSKYLVRPSIPILYFGNFEKYSQSSLKVITVGLNPSKREFPNESPFLRFPSVNQAFSENTENYLRALNNYFYEKPYTSWFGFFEEVLNGFDSSYYGKKTNTALHTDLLSPLATDPTWSALPDIEKKSFSVQGIPLWHKLVNKLSPDIILVSIRKSHLNDIGFKRLSDWKTVYSIERKNPYHVLIQKIELASKKHSFLVFGKAAEKPFASIKHVDKNRIGSFVLKSINEV